VLAVLIPSKFFTGLLAAACLAIASAGVSGAPFKVLAVMSYEENNPWVAEMRDGIEFVLGSSSRITYVYMDTKVDRDGGPAKAAEAFAVFEELKPDGVLAFDDNAQSMFVVPYLKDKFSTPVMFGGVNAQAEQYGFPNAHVSGVLERAHVRESLAFIKQLVPDVTSACFVTNDVPAGASLRAQVEREKDSYPVSVHAFKLAADGSSLADFFADQGEACGVVFIDSLEGMRNANGDPMDNREALTLLRNYYKGPVVGGNRYQVEQGAWAAVVKTGQEQGASAAEMLLSAMRGTPVSAIPIIRNTKGQRIINVTQIEANEVPLRPIVIRGATLVRQQD
jgi:ABC-type uncharacterized transport system substrate-binding protein